MHFIKLIGVTFVKLKVKIFQHSSAKEGSKSEEK